jgi:hypothetical protein
LSEEKERKVQRTTKRAVKRNLYVGGVLCVEDVSVAAVVNDSHPAKEGGEESQKMRKGERGITEANEACDSRRSLRKDFLHCGDKRGRMNVTKHCCRSVLIPTRSATYAKRIAV